MARSTDLNAPLLKADEGTTTSDKTAGLRQQRRRDKLKEEKARSPRVVLTAERAAKVERLLAAGYGANQSEVMARALDEVQEGSVEVLDDVRK